MTDTRLNKPLVDIITIPGVKSSSIQADGGGWWPAIRSATGKLLWHDSSQAYASRSGAQSKASLILRRTRLSMMPLECRVLADSNQLVNVETGEVVAIYDTTGMSVNEAEIAADEAMVFLANGTLPEFWRFIN